MSGRWRSIAGFVALALLVAYAYAPLVDIGLVREDFEILASAARALERSASPLGAAFAVARTNGHPLAGLSLLCSHELWSDAGSWHEVSALPLRLENLVLLVVGASGLGLFVRRLLRPWTGSEQANAAGWAVAFLVALHPFHVVGTATLAARPHLLAVAFGAWSGAAFLRGRQERRFGYLVVAALLALGAALSGGIGLCLPLLLFGAEWISARRYRPPHTRLRTAANTLLIFGGCVALDMLLRSAHARAFRGPSFLSSLSEVEGPTGGLRTLLIAIEKLGLVLLPINVAGLGIAGYAIAGALVLTALQPALVAARSAPRLWGWLLFSWTALLALSMISDFDVRVQPSDLSDTRVLLPMSIVMAVGMAVAATALPGSRRVLLPFGLVLGSSILAHGNALPWVAAAKEIRGLRRDLGGVRETYGAEVDLLLIDPAGATRRVDALGNALPWLVTPRFAGQVPYEPGSERWVRSITADAFRAFVREREFDQARERGLVALYREDAPTGQLPLVPGASPRRRAHHIGVLLAPAEVPDDLRPWYREGRSPGLDLDPFEVRALAVVGAAGGDQPVAGAGSAAPPTAPRVGWRARSQALAEGELDGAWYARAGARTAVFDLHASLAWLFAERVRRIWSVSGWSAMEEAALALAPPALAPELAPAIDGDDWIFSWTGEDPLAAAGERAPLAGGAWELELFDLASLRLWRFSGELQESAPGGVRVLVADAEEVVLQIVRAGGGPVAWTLSATVAGVPVGEAHGRRRRVGRRNSQEEA